MATASKHTITDLHQMQGMSLNDKIRMTKRRITEWVDEYGEDGVYVSFSGGKDSTVLLTIAREMYPDMKAMFVDTGLEYPEIRQFVKTFSNVDWVKPKVNFRQVIEKYGYPFISKEVSECVYGARKYLKQIMEQENKRVKREEQRCIYCGDYLAKKGCLGMCNKHYIQYKRWGDPLHSDKKERATIEGYYRDGKTGRREHRVIWEQHYGEQLKKEEVIHHINFVKTDNRIENLYKYANASEHTKAHWQYEKLMQSLGENEEIFFENGEYLKRERESIQTDSATLSLLFRKSYWNGSISEASERADTTCTVTKRKEFLEYTDRESTRRMSGGVPTISGVNSEELRNIIESRPKGEGQRLRLARLMGMLTGDGQIKANVPNKDRSMFSQVRYQFFLDAPFEISQKCCSVMKKEPAHRYAKETGRYPITAQMASESRLRTQQWIRNGCNGFHLGNPISNPMSFWTEQDVLLYIYKNKIPIASVYGDVVVDYAATGDIEGQMSIRDFGGDWELFDLDRPLLKTTGCERTGCMFCGYGAHLERGEGRFVRMKRTHPKQYDYIMRPWEEGGLNYKEVIDWINEHGNMNIKY